ncbi:MAG: hypothetical protein H0X12_17845 [Nocardioides sp.]|nr:hypothetical protein [Nocardioides sp.]
MRVAVAAVATLLWCAFGLAFGSFSGLSSERLGWLWMALVYAAGLALAVLLARGGRAWFVGAVVAAVALGTLHWLVSPPTTDRIADAAADVETPAGFDEVSRDARGNTWCFKGCPQVEVTYVVPGSIEEAETAMAAALEDDGWSASGDNTWKHGIYQATMTQNTSLDEVGLSVSYSGRS